MWCPTWLYTATSSWQNVDMINPLRYPILECKERVPTGAWENKNLIIERFLPEKDGGLFFLRYWIFLGDNGWSGRFGAKTPIVKFHHMVTEDEVIPIPDELKSLREKMGIDYGRLDYVEHNGEIVLFDVNKTIGGAHHLDKYALQLDSLAYGMNGFLNK
jgi:hypothetical protein